MTLHFDTLMIIGLCCLPAAVVAFYLLLFVFQSWEIGALGFAGPAAVIVFAAGIAMFLVGLGQEIH